MKLVLEIPYATPSINDVAKHRYGRVNLRKKWERRITDAWYAAKADGGLMGVCLMPPGRKMRVSIERFTPVLNSLDVDNLWGGAKPVVDALQVLKFIDDDDPQSIDLDVAQRLSPYAPPRYWTRITLEPYPPS